MEDESTALKAEKIKGGCYMKKFKKLTAGLLGVVMALGVCSFTAFAAGNEAKIGKTEYATLQEAVDKATDGDTIVLLDNASINSLGRHIEKNITYDLNGHDLTYSGGTVVISENHTLAFKDSSASSKGIGGTLELTGIKEDTSANFNVQTGGSLSVSNINITSAGSVFFPQGDSALVDIRYCNVETSGAYCVGTNAATTNNYNVVISILNSKLTCKSNSESMYPNDNTAVLINVAGSLIIKDSELVADRQALIARAGDVTVENTELTVTGKYAEKAEGNDTKYQNSKWRDGNEVPMGAVIVGNDNGNIGAYLADSVVTIENCKITSEKDSVPAIFTEATDDHPSSIEIIGKDTVVTGAVKKGVNEDDTTIKIIDGKFTDDYENIKDYIDTDSEYITDKNGNIIIMGEEAYEDYLDSKRPSHSYSLSEKKPEDRDDDEEEEPVVTPEPEEEEGPFSDVGKDNPNYDAIVEVYEKGWMAGIGDGVFAPNGTLTRGMAVTILWNRAGQPEPASVAPFLDVTSDAWYAKAVAWAYENGITSGYGDTYGPDDFLTTEQFTRMNDIANGRTPEVYVGGAPYATRGWVAGMLVME